MGRTGIAGLRLYIRWLRVLVFSLRYTVPKLNDWGRSQDYFIFNKAFPFG